MIEATGNLLGLFAMVLLLFLTVAFVSHRQSWFTPAGLVVLVLAAAFFFICFVVILTHPEWTLH